MTTQTTTHHGGSAILAAAPATQTASGVAPVLIRCACCSVPVAERQGDSLIIRSRHHGREHVTVIPLSAVGY